MADGCAGYAVYHMIGAFFVYPPWAFDMPVGGVGAFHQGKIGYYGAVVGHHAASFVGYIVYYRFALGIAVDPLTSVSVGPHNAAGLIYDGHDGVDIGMDGYSDGPVLAVVHGVMIKKRGCFLHKKIP